MSVLGAKWAMLAVRELTFGQHRFDDIVRNTGAPRDVLTERLRQLEDAGLVERVLYNDRPKRYEYHLTSVGEGLFGILHAIRDWGDGAVRHDPENVVQFEHHCGQRLEAVVVCKACGEELHDGDVRAERELHRSDLEPASA
ncbi:transcriptional regulator [Curtobacterium sp. MCBD17_034]|nr:transcriptional regulator [Curtobacterium sp. MCBD17_034]PZM33939.1 transcriptional regulator [Curtobacterium sp. MCBD17_031]